MSTAAPWTVGRLLQWTADYLKGRGADSPRLDAEILLAQALGCQRIQLYTAFEDVPQRGQADRLPRIGPPAGGGNAGGLSRRAAGVLFAEFQSRSGRAHPAAGDRIDRRHAARSGQATPLSLRERGRG